MVRGDNGETIIAQSLISTPGEKDVRDPESTEVPRI